jgi:hypothetical protein
MHERTFRHLRGLRARLMIQALGGVKQRLNSISRLLDGRNQSKNQRARPHLMGATLGATRCLLIDQQSFIQIDNDLIR